MNARIARSTVERGMAFLDRRLPGWEARIDLARLDTRSPQQCLLGQLFGTFARGAAAIGAPPTFYGFDLPPYADNAEGHALLTAAWREGIAARRLAAAGRRVPVTA